MMKTSKISLLKKDLGIMKHFLKLVYKVDKSYILLLILSAVFKGISPFINIIIPKFIIDELLGKKRIEVFILLVLIIIVANGFFAFINKLIGMFVDIKYQKLLYGFDLIVGQKVMDLDFEKIEDPKILNLKEQAMAPIKQQGALYRIVQATIDMISQLVILTGLIGLISTLNPLIIVFIIAIVILNSFILKKSQRLQYNFYQSLTPINREGNYYTSLAEDFTVSKDIRLYDMKPLVSQKIEEFNENIFGNFSILFGKLGKYLGINRIFTQLQTMAVYGYIAIKVLKGIIDMGQFTMYTNATIKFSNTISQFFKTYVEITQMCRYLEFFIKLESIETPVMMGKEHIDNLKEYVIEFRNVSFKYPRSNSYTLKNINIVINEGEKLSVVGLNGAGKTTFIKLLCRLYEATEGEILLNGVNILEYDYDEYTKLLSVVFQDFKLLAFSIKENIGLSQWEVAADKEIEEVIEKAGFGEDLKKLKKGIYTSIYKVFDKEGIEFSGGQSQKLAIARAIYKNAPIVILDEPTAALDPFAEFEIYSRFNELVGDKTAIYISHRLSSCKFCDNIAVFKDGEIVEYGNHDKLVKADGLYEEMYMAQAQYYV